MQNIQYYAEGLISHHKERLGIDNKSYAKSIVLAIGALTIGLVLCFMSWLFIPLFLGLLFVGVPAFFLFNHGVKGLLVNAIYYIISKKLNFYIKSAKAGLWIWKFIYNTLSLVHPQKDMTFLNYGYADSSEGGVFIEQFVKSKEAYQVQLYNALIMQQGGIMNMKDQFLMEIGCGRGGGLNYLIRELSPEKTYGVDISEANIAFCKRAFEATVRLRNVDLIVGDAQNLQDIEQLEPQLVDYIVCVESAHCFTDLDAFLFNVHTLLKKNGQFFFADFRDAEQMVGLKKQITKYFEIEKEEDIGKQVLRALDLGTEKKKKVIKSNFPWYMRYFLYNTSGIKHSHFYDQLEQGKYNYFSYVLRKKETI